MPFAVPRGGPEPQPAPDSDEVRALREEAEQLRHAVHSRAAVDQAIGVVIARGGLSPQEAWDVLREVSMRTHTKLRVVAEQLVAWVQTAELPPVLRAELERQLALRREEHDAGPVPSSSPPDEGLPLPARSDGER
ncbi:ANTAR domain-containing protein [Streptomyces spectabilis]|uniref:ANTAR domain-containing protein n=1 Tax=Streptomyces spectabilis TaxID=68270 RepID=A0A516R0W5_STRST|nr:ANTAR domain-containing protein [Streptomyces spectabilis]QDQ09280.1 ANTAR domain-containing protein [Streptomyces spectabilis]